MDVPTVSSSSVAPWGWDEPGPHLLRLRSISAFIRGFTSEQGWGTQTLHSKACSRLHGRACCPDPTAPSGMVDELQQLPLPHKGTAR